MTAAWLKFYPADWRSDPALRSCSLAARGLWVEMMAIMHEADPYGSLLIKGRRVEKRLLASLVGTSEKELAVLLLELEGFGVLSRDEDGTIYSRRMRRDAAKAAADKENGKRGGNPKVKGGVNPQVNGEVKAQIPEARSQNSEAKASAAAPPAEPDDPRKRLFGEGLATLAELTGKGPDACRSFVGKCLKEAEDDAVTVLGLIAEAKRNRVADPAAWIKARLKPYPAASPGTRATTVFQHDQLVARDIGNALADFASGRGRGSTEDPRVLSDNPRIGSARIRNGIGGTVVDVSPRRGEAGEPRDGYSVIADAS